MAFDFYIANEFWFAFTQLALAMFGMGAGLRPSDFKAVATEPRAFTVGVLIQIAAVPVLAFIFIRVLPLHPGVAMGLALAAAVPGGSISNVLTYFAKGDVPLSLAITAVTSFACLLTTPYVLELLAGSYLNLETFVMPAAEIAWEIFASVLLPLVLGMVFLKLLPANAPAVAKWSIRLSLFTILLIIAGSMGAGRINFGTFGFANAVYIVLFITTLLALAFTVCVVFNLKTPELTAVAVEVCVRNINIAILLKTIIFPATAAGPDPVGDMVLFTVLFYGGTQLFFAPPVISFYYVLNKYGLHYPRQLGKIILGRTWSVGKAEFGGYIPPES